MAEEHEAKSVRRRVVDRATEMLKAERAELPEEFLARFGELLGATRAPKADAFLALFEKQVGGE